MGLIFFFFSKIIKALLKKKIYYVAFSLFSLIPICFSSIGPNGATSQSLPGQDEGDHG